VITPNAAFHRTRKSRAPVKAALAGIQISASEPVEQFPSLFYGSGAGGIGCRGWIWGVTRKWVPGAIGRRAFI